MRHMVVHLEGCEKEAGPFPKWVHEQTDLRLVATGPGSFVAELSLVSPEEELWGRANHGPAALEALLRWNGRESSTLPGVVTNELYAISSTAPPGMTIWMGTADDRRRVRFERSPRSRVPLPEKQDALLQGWLKEVNWKSRTAQLHDYAGDFVRLRFGADLDEKMKELATAYVEVVGRGHFDSKGEWKTVLVDHVTATRSYDEPFDLHAFLNDPHPKVFDPDKVVTASEPFDVHEFIRIIRQGRDAE